MLQSTTSNQFIYKDHLHEIIDTSSKPFLKEIILLATLYWFYTNTSSEVFITFIKYIVILIIIRYILSILTEIRDHNDKKYFVLNANVIIFTLMILFMNNFGVLVHQNLISAVIITSYSLLVISTKECYTSDVLLTLVITYSFFNNSSIRYFTSLQ